MTTTLLTVACLMVAPQDRPIRILPLGDSITQGGRNDRAEHTYRLPLFRMLRQEGIKFDFIGSMRTGLHADAKWPNVDGTPFDLDHEGHYGWKTAAVRDKLAEWMPKWAGPPDIALIHLGTNDQGDDPTAAIVRPMTEIVGMLRRANPRVVVLIGHLNFNGGKAAEAIRPAVSGMVAALNRPESPVVAVSHYEGWIEDPSRPNTDTFDWAHPNPQGQEKMARAWLRAMRPYLKRY